MRSTMYWINARLCRLTLFVWCLMVFAGLTPGIANAQVNGGIFTTDINGTKVNGNLYKLKTDVYLNGGPQNTKDPGLVPDGLYYFQVTNPSGSVLLSADDITCRQVIVQNGRIIGVPGDSETPFGTAASGSPNGCNSPGDSNHPVGNFNATNNEQPVQLCPNVLSPPRSNTLGNPDAIFDPANWCDTTPNPGGEYKAWLTPQSQYVGPGGTCAQGRNVFGFCDSESKTDNFKVQPPSPPPCVGDGCPGPPPLSASLVACKYWDKNDDGAGLPDIPADVPLGGWTLKALTTSVNLTITAENPDNSQTASQGTAFGLTDNTDGCTKFDITGFTDISEIDTITLSEVLQTNWNQVGPLSSAGGVTYDGGTGGDITALGNCSADPVTSLVAPCSTTINVPVIGDGSTTVSPDFGNTGLDLTVSKTANPSFTRTYNWSINKTLVSPTGNPVEQSGSSAIITYNVTASETGFTDTAWEVTGNISVGNPNSFDVSGVTVTDAVSDAVADGASCSVTDPNSGADGNPAGGPYKIPAGSSLTLSYTCTYSSQPPYGTTLTNTATADWRRSTSNLTTSADTSASSPAVEFTFNTGTAPNPTLVNSSITVVDCFANGTTTFSGTPATCSGTQTTLGTLTAVDTAPFTAHTYTVTDKVTITGGSCSTFTNTAEISTTSQFSPDVTVTICNERTGALTMGFWQNKNGQGIITGSASTSGVCNAGTALRAYNPFMDLSPTATCNQVATYVFNVIKAANAAGSSMNAMLKAQMLATALDVYFGGGPGGDPIKNFNGGITTNIGAVKINLAKICVMIDSSGGSASCSGATENCSAAFGGAGCLTVSQMLSFAASAATPATSGNPLASPWYNQNKTTQGLAKNAFDAVNNQAAFICP